MSKWFPVKVGLRQGCVKTVSLHGVILKITETRVIVNVYLQELYNNNIIYHDFLPTPRRGSHVKSDKTHTQSLRYTP